MVHSGSDCLVLGRNELWEGKETWRNLECISPSERRQSDKGPPCKIPALWRAGEREPPSSRSVVFDYLQSCGLQHARLPCPSPSPGACSNSCPLSWWCHPTISASVTSFSSCPKSFQHQGLFQWVSSSPLVAQALVSASTSVLPMNTQNRFSLGWTGWISVQSKGLSRVFSNTTVQKHQFFGAQPSLWSKSCIHT